MKNLFFAFTVVSFGMLQAQNIIAEVDLTTENIKEVRIEGSFVDVYVTKGDKVTFQGIIKGNGEKGDYRFDTDVVGSTLFIKVTYTKSKYNWKNYRLAESRMDITIPEGVILDIDNSSGDIRVDNLRAETSKLEASSGDITVRGTICNLDVETSSGNVEIVDLIGDSEIETTSGEQEYRNTKGNIEAVASSGDITFVDFEGDLDIRTTSGDVDLRRGKGVIASRTSSGDIDGDELTLTGNSDFGATSGDIEIDFTQDIASMSFDLTATSGELRVGNKESERRWNIERGGIVVKGVTSSGNQEYR